MDTIQIIALTMGTAWASGINLYATILMLGILGNSGHIVLPAELEVVTDPLVITAAGIMYIAEFFADKTPGVDSAWDGFHTFIRIPAGAMLAMAAVGDTTPAVEIAAFLLGGTLAAGSHATKTGTRILLNTSPEPVSNWTASITEDLLVIGGIWAALIHPWLFLGTLIIFIGVMIWLLPKIGDRIKKLFELIKDQFRSQSPANPASLTGPETGASEGISGRAQ